MDTYKSVILSVVCRQTDPRTVLDRNLGAEQPELRLLWPIKHKTGTSGLTVPDCQQLYAQHWIIQPQWRRNHPQNPRWNCPIPASGRAQWHSPRSSPSRPHGHHQTGARHRPDITTPIAVLLGVSYW